MTCEVPGLIDSELTQDTRVYLDRVKTALDMQRGKDFAEQEERRTRLGVAANNFNKAVGTKNLIQTIQQVYLPDWKQKEFDLGMIEDPQYLRSIHDVIGSGFYLRKKSTHNDPYTHMIYAGFAFKNVDKFIKDETLPEVAFGVTYVSSPKMSPQRTDSVTALGYLIYKDFEVNKIQKRRGSGMNIPTSVIGQGNISNLENFLENPDSIERARDLLQEGIVEFFSRNPDGAPTFSPADRVNYLLNLYGPGFSYYNTSALDLFKTETNDYFMCLNKMAKSEIGFSELLSLYNDYASYRRGGGGTIIFRVESNSAARFPREHRSVYSMPPAIHDMFKTNSERGIRIDRGPDDFGE